jgi:hypothetical protein
METTVIKDKNGGSVSVPVTEWMPGNVHPFRDGEYEFLTYGAVGKVPHRRTYQAGAWRSTLNPDHKFNALPLDQWRGLTVDIDQQSAANCLVK